MVLSKRKKLWLIIVSAILIIIIILLILLNQILSNTAETYLKNQLSGMDTTSYSIDFEKIRVNVFFRSVNVHGITIKPTESAMDEVKQSRLDKLLAEVSIPKIKISGIGIMNAISGKEYSAGSIRIVEPDIIIYGPQDIFHRNLSKSSGTGIFSSDTIMETAVKEAFLGSFKIEDAHLSYINLSNGKTELETKGLSLRIDDLWLHNLPGDTLSHVLDLDEIEISVKSHSMDLPGNLYRIDIGPFEASYNDQDLKLDSLRLIPAYSKERFGQVVGKQTDRFAVSVDHLNISGIEFDSLLNKKIIIDNILLEGPYADIYRDKRIPRDMTHFPKLFQTSVAGIPMALFVKSINVSNGYVNYQEMAEGATQAGAVIFDKMDVLLTGVCNYADSIKNGQAIRVDAQAQLMGKSPVQLYFKLPIGNKKEYFTFHGNVSSFPATNINSMIEPLAFIGATSGTVNSVNYYAVACCDTAIGRIEFKYQDLKVEVLKKNKDSEKASAENKFLSFLAKTVMHKNNPHEGKPVRIARMSFVRNPNKGFFNYVWKTIQDGLIKSMTPGKKHLASDMSWPDFKARWEKNLWKDRQALNAKNSKKKGNK